MHQGADPDGAAAAVPGADAAEAFRLIAENASDVVYRADPDGVITWISPSAEALFGWPPADIVGRSISDFIHPDDRDATLEFWRSVIATAASGRVESRIVRRDGVAVWVAGSARPARTDDGSVVGFVGDLRDIDAEREARDALAARTAELEEARRITRLGVWRRDLRTGTTTWSREMFEIFGFDPAGPPPAPETIDALLPPESRAARDRAVAASDADGTWGTELEIRRTDGTARWVRQNGAVARDAAGTVIAYHGTARDITERKRAELAVEASEARLRATLEAAPESFAIYAPVLDADGRFVDAEIVYMNGIARDRWFAGGPLEEVRGTRVFERLPQFRSNVFDIYRDVVDTGVPFAEVRRLESPAGEIWMDLRVAPVPGGFVHTSRDITAARLAQQAVERAHAELAEAQRIAHVGSWTFDIASDQPAWSDEYFRIFGLEPGGEVPPYAGQERLFTPESWARLGAAVAAASAEGTAYEIPLEIVRPDGAHRQTVARGEAVRDATGAIVGLRGTLADVTELRRAEATIRASEERYRTDRRYGRRRDRHGTGRRDHRRVERGRDADVRLCRRRGDRPAGHAHPAGVDRRGPRRRAPSLRRERRPARRGPHDRGDRATAGRDGVPDRAVALRVARRRRPLRDDDPPRHHREAGGGCSHRTGTSGARRGPADRACRELDVRHRVGPAGLVGRVLPHLRARARAGRSHRMPARSVCSPRSRGRGWAPRSRPPRQKGPPTRSRSRSSGPTARTGRRSRAARPCAMRPARSSACGGPSRT